MLCPKNMDGPVNPLVTDALPKKHGVDTTDQIRKSYSFTVMGTEGGECCTTSQCLDVIPTVGWVSVANLRGLAQRRAQSNA